MNVQAMVTGVIITIVAIIVIFSLVGGSSTALTDAADNISGSGLPLSNLFGSSGVVLLIFMAGILLAIIGMALKKHHKG